MTTSKHERDARVSARSAYEAEAMAFVGLTAEQSERDAERAEDETCPDPLTGRVYYGLHLDTGDEPLVSMSVRLPKSMADRLTAQAKRYHISRSEYIRRRLVDA